MESLKNFLKKLLKRTFFVRWQVVLEKTLEANKKPQSLRKDVKIYLLKESDLTKLGKYISTMEYSSPFTIDDASQRLAEGQICIVSEVENKIAGFIWLSPVGVYFPFIGKKVYPGKDAVLHYNAHVDKDFRGQGIWEMILNSADELLRAKGIRKFVSLVFPWNKGSLRGLWKNNFAPTGRLFFGNFLGVSFSIKLNVKRNLMKYINTPVFIYLDTSGNGLSVLRELSKHKIPVHAFSNSKKNPSFKSRYGVKHICPSPTNETEFIEFLIRKSSLLRTKPLFVPTTDSVLNLLIKYHSLLAKYFVFPFEDPERILALLDKLQLTEICRKHNITYPETHEWIACTQKEKPTVNNMTFPILFKPIYHGKIERFHERKLFVINNQQEWERYSKVIYENKVDVIVQEAKTNCRYFGFYAYFDGKRFPDSYLIYEKLLQYPDEFGTGVLCEKTGHEGIVTEVRNFIDKYPFCSIAEIEFVEERDSGKLYLIEINPRSIVPNSLATKSGVELILDAYSKITGYQGDRAKRYTDGAFWVDEAGLLSYLIEHKRARNSLKPSIIQIVKTRKVSFSYFEATDILPFVLCLKRTLSPYLFSASK